MIERIGRFRKVVVLAIVCLSFSRASLALTVHEENEISREFMRYIHQQYDLVTDPEIARYIQGLGDRILANYPSQPFTYRFYVIKNETYNAFAGPGARIFIHSGLFEALGSEDELAGIIGHEISHSACRHISENIDRSGKIGLGTLAGVAAGIFMAIYGDPAAGSAMTVGSLAGAQTVALAYSREDEIQADQMGLNYLIKAGYRPEGLIDALQVIRSRQWYGKEQIPAYLTTHPALEDRISFITGWIEQNPVAPPDKKPGDALAFRMIHARVKALYGDPQKALVWFDAILGKTPDDLPGLYGKGMVLSRLGKAEEAVACLKKALEKRALDVSVLKTLGRVYFDNGMYAQARSVFEGALSLVPRDYEGNLYMARLLAQSGRYDQAIAHMMPFASDQNGDPGIFYYLGDIYAKKGMPAESYYHLGMYYRNRMDAKNALTQFERALKLAESDDLKVRIQARLDEARGEEKKQRQAAEGKAGSSDGLSRRGWEGP
ncbi:M48 family metalloprotease [Desulfatiferula olefinivorans]